MRAQKLAFSVPLLLSLIAVDAYAGGNCGNPFLNFLCNVGCAVGVPTPNCPGSGNNNPPPAPPSNATQPSGGGSTGGATGGTTSGSTGGSGGAAANPNGGTSAGGTSGGTTGGTPDNGPPPQNPSDPNPKTSPTDSTNLVQPARTPADLGLGAGLNQQNGGTSNGGSSGGSGSSGGDGFAPNAGAGTVSGHIVGSFEAASGVQKSDTSQIRDANRNLEDMLKQSPQPGTQQASVDPNEVAALVASQRGGRDAAVSLARSLQSQELLRSAREKITLGNWDAALNDLNSLLARDPLNAPALAKRAEALNHLKLYKDAEKDAMKALSIDKNNPAAWQQLAWSLLKQKRYAEALEAINRALELDPKNATDYAIRSYIREALGDHTGALEDLARAAALDARYADAYAKAKQGGRIYDPEEDTMAGTVANDAAKRRVPLWPWGAALGVLLVMSMIGNLRRAKPEASTAKQAAMIAQRPAAAAFKAESGGKIIGKYELGRVIGRGGMGEVYEAKDLSLSRAVAIKRVSSLASELATQGRAQMLKEARTVAALHHPAIVDVYEIVEDGDDIYLVFEFVKGKTVHQLLVEEGGRFSVGRALEILKPVCEALQFAHGQNLVHRDLKPANIMVTEQGHVKLMDFGIARSIGEAAPAAAAPAPSKPAAFARTQFVVGTPSYMSPETGEGIVCREADVYSLGVTLYEMLTGRLPFAAEASVMEKLAMKCAAPTQLQPSLPKAVDELIGMALQPKIEHRLKSPKDFLARLEAVAAAAKVAA